MIATAPDTIRAADIAVVGMDVPRDRSVRPRDVILAVEIAATSLAEDPDATLADHARLDIAEYWVVNLEAKVVHAPSEPNGDNYADCRVVRFGEPLPVPGTDATIVID